MAVKGNKFVLICSTAITLVYSAGYMVTGGQSSAESKFPISNPYVASQQLEMQSEPDNIDSNNNLAANQPNSTHQNSNNSSQSNSLQTNHTQSTTQTHHSVRHKLGKYRDGSYHGQGSNSIGSVEVAVSIKNSKIAAVQITNCTTSYPQSEIDGLPAQVVERQSANIDFVSGATRSSEDFQQAVQEALQQAKNV